MVSHGTDVQTDNDDGNHCIMPHPMRAGHSKSWMTPTLPAVAYPKFMPRVAGSSAESDDQSGLWGGVHFPQMVVLGRGYTTKVIKGVYRHKALKPGENVNNTFLK